VRVRPIAGAGPVAVAEVVTGADGVFAIEPLHPGTWRLSIERPGYPAPHVEARTLGEGAQWDLGTIRLEAGGTAEFRSASPAVDAKALHCMVSDDKGRRWVLSRDGEFPRTPLLADGPYRLQVWGRGCAARVVPFTIVAGQRTAVEIAAVPCVRQRLELAVPDAVAVGPGATLRVTAGDETLVDWWLPVPVGAPWTCELWLKPGTYRVTAAGRLRGTAELRIGTTEAAAVRLEMRRPGR
jgi:hypothetical protein